MPALNGSHGTKRLNRMLPSSGRSASWAEHDLDAIHLSAGGYLTTAGLAIPVEDDLATVLAGWDPT